LEVLDIPEVGPDEVVVAEVEGVCGYVGGQAGILRGWGEDVPWEEKRLIG
jgi:hypothetical protein